MNVNSLSSFLPSVLLNFTKFHLRFVYMEKPQGHSRSIRTKFSNKAKQTLLSFHAMKPALTYLRKIVRPNYEHRKRTEYTTADFASCKNSMNIVCMEIFKWMYLTWNYYYISQNFTISLTNSSLSPSWVVDLIQNYYAMFKCKN